MPIKKGDAKWPAMIVAQVGCLAWKCTGHVFACVSEPEAIVIGGGVSKAGQPLIDEVEKYYRNMHLQQAKKLRSIWQHWEMMQEFTGLRVWF